MDVVPELYRKELSVLQNGVPPKPPHEVHAMIAEQLGKSVGELFATFELRVTCDRACSSYCTPLYSSLRVLYRECTTIHTLT